MEKWAEDPLEHTMYRRLVGKIMFIVMKIFSEGANAEGSWLDTLPILDQITGRSWEHMSVI
jgi:hypothetical protein